MPAISTITGPDRDPELTRERLDALDAMSNRDLLLRAAHIIGRDPVVVEGSFRYLMGRSSLAAVLQVPSRFIADQTVACHCLEGAVREAAGVYRIPADKPALTYTVDIPEVAAAFSRRRDVLERAIVQAFDQQRLVQLLDEQPIHTSGHVLTIKHIRAGFYDSAAVVYHYSDRVLAKMGGEGPAEAARILTRAADLVIDHVPNKETSA